MPGASMKVEVIGEEKVRRRLDNLVRAGRDAAPFGARYRNAHAQCHLRPLRGRIRTAIHGDVLRRRKTRNADKSLIRDGDLTCRPDRDSVEIGSPSVCAHWFDALGARARRTNGAADVWPFFVIGRPLASVYLAPRHGASPPQYPATDKARVRSRRPWARYDVRLRTDCLFLCPYRKRTACRRI